MPGPTLWLGAATQWMRHLCSKGDGYYTGEYQGLHDAMLGAPPRPVSRGQQAASGLPLALTACKAGDGSLRSSGAVRTEPVHKPWPVAWSYGHACVTDVVYFDAQQALQLDGRMDSSNGAHTLRAWVETMVGMIWWSPGDAHGKPAEVLPMRSTDAPRRKTQPTGPAPVLAAYQEPHATVALPHCAHACCAQYDPTWCLAAFLCASTLPTMGVSVGPGRT